MFSLHCPFKSFYLVSHIFLLVSQSLFLLTEKLSLQTDMMDLLGSDLPVESDEGMKFAWSDGILLQVVNFWLHYCSTLRT